MSEQPIKATWTGDSGRWFPALDLAVFPGDEVEIPPGLVDEYPNHWNVAKAPKAKPPTVEPQAKEPQA